MEPEDSDQTDPRHMDDIPCLILEGKSGEILENAFKMKECLVSNLSVSELIIDYLNDSHLMNLISLYISEHMGEAKFQKPLEEATVLRKQGNIAFQKKELVKALELFTNSVVKAPGLPDTCLAMAYANRSAVLNEMKEYGKCLVDIELALNNGYPDDCKFKLYHRQGECLLHLGRLAEALVAANSAEEWAKRAADTIGTTKMETFLAEVEEIRRRIAESDSRAHVTKEDKELQLSYGMHPQLDPLSAAVTIVHSEEKGRHTIANRSLEVGDVLIVERPFVAALVPDLFQDDHCWNCTLPLKSLSVPCQFCSQVQFCCEDCRQEAWTKHHYMECGFQHFLIHMWQSFVPWRILLTVGVEQMLKIRDDLKTVKSPDKVPGFDSQGRYDHSSYYTIYHMKCFDVNSNIKMKQDCVNVAVYALRFLELLYPIKVESGDIQVESRILNLRKTKLKVDKDEESCEVKKAKFGDGLDIPESTCFTWEERVFLASVLARHFLQVKCNACYIDEYFRYPSDSCPIQLLESQPLGGGVFPASSLFNHSCDPNVAVTSVGTLNIFKTIREVKADEEVCISYGPNWYEKPRDQRQKHLLENYNFQCRCQVCEAEKGIVDVSMIAFFKDPASGMNALNDYDMSLVRTMERFSKASLNLVMGNLRVALVMFEECLLQCQEHLRKNRRNYNRMFGETLEQMWSVLDQMGKVCSDVSVPGKQTCFFEGIEVNNASRSYVALMLEGLKMCMDSVSNIDIKSGMESDIFSGWALRFIRVFLKMIPNYPDVRNNPDWLLMAEDIVGLVVKIRINREIHFARSDGYMEYIEDIENYMKDGLHKKGRMLSE